MFTSTVGRVANRVLGGARDAWQIFGLALLVLLAVEGAYRLQLAAKLALRPVPTAIPAGHPYSGQAWYKEFSAALDRRRSLLDPYRAFTLEPMVSPYLNIDSTGQRLTPQPAMPGARTVLLLGGSAMWGLSARDSQTIAAHLAVALALRGAGDVQVVSLAEPGYNSTQEAATLTLELAQGRVPAAAVIMDGYNDIAIAMNTGIVGRVYDQSNAQRLLNLGQRGFVAELFGLGRHSALIQRIQAAIGPAQARPARDAEQICPAVAAYYAGIQRTVQAVARTWGFPALVFLQPHNAASAKPPTPFEATLPRDPQLARCFAAIDSAMAPEAGRTFFDLRGVFDADTVTRFVDRHSHVTEDANRIIASLIADRLAPQLARAVVRPAQ
jgi:hypothetical protein